jgi:hypothetical protein
VLAFSVIKLENFRALHKNSIEPARFGFPSPRRHLLTFRASQALPRAAKREELRSCRLFGPGANLAPGISNRELHLLERLLTYRKQTTAPRSNRELSTNQRGDNSYVPGFLPSSLTSSTEAFVAKNSALPSAFLPGTSRYVESDVTHSKQKTAPFLPGTRNAHRGVRVSYATRAYLHIGNAIAPRNPRA